MIANGSAPRSDQGISYESEYPELNAAFNGAFNEYLSEITSSYYAGQHTRYLPTPNGISLQGSGADFHYLYEHEYMRMLERSRYFDRDNMVVGQGVNRLVANVLHDGFVLDPDTGDAELDLAIKARWAEESQDPEAFDYEGEKTWAELEALSFRSQIVDGDQVVIPTTNGTLQFVESHRMRNPWGQRKNIIHGVELESGRRRVALHLTPEEINPLHQVSQRTNFQRIPVRNSAGERQIFHLYNPKRMTQTRGVSALAPSVIPITYHDDLQFANMVKAKVASFYAIFRQYAETIKLPGGNRQSGARSTETQADGSTRVFQQGAPGQEIKGEPGETLTGFSPNIPNPEFFQHASLILSFVAINLDLPMIVFMLDGSATNFSGWRGAIDQARLRFRQMQIGYRSHFHIPIYRFKLRHWLQRDAALRNAAQRSNVNLFRHTWHLPVPAYIEPMKDAAADDLQISRNLTSQRCRAQRRGLDFDDLSNEIVDDRALIVVKAKRKADQLNKDFPDLAIDWRELAYGHKSSGIQYAFTADKMGDEEGSNKGGSNGSDDTADQKAG